MEAIKSELHRRLRAAERYRGPGPSRVGRRASASGVDVTAPGSSTRHHSASAGHLAARSVWRVAHHLGVPPVLEFPHVVSGWVLRSERVCSWM